MKVILSAGQFRVSHLMSCEESRSREARRPIDCGLNGKRRVGRFVTEMCRPCRGSRVDCIIIVLLSTRSSLAIGQSPITVISIDGPG